MTLNRLLQEIEKAAKEGLWELLPDLDERFRQRVEQQVAQCPPEQALDLRDQIEQAQLRYRAIVNQCIDRQQHLREQTQTIAKQRQATQQYLDQR